MAGKKKVCQLCKNKCEKLFSPGESLVGNQLSSVIKTICSNKKLELPPNFLICLECSLALIQAKIIIKRLCKTLSISESKQQDKFNETMDENTYDPDKPTDKENCDFNNPGKEAPDVENVSLSWTFDCTHCEYATNKANLYKHHRLFEHQIDDLRIYKCMHCNKSYQRANAIQKHIAKVHERKPLPQHHEKSGTNDKEPFLSSTTIEDQLNSECFKGKAIDHNTTDKNDGTSSTYVFKCDHCNYEIGNPKYFKNHLKTKHQIEDARIYKCRKCPTTYARLFALQNHIAYQHENKSRPAPQRRKSVPPDFEITTANMSYEADKTLDDLQCEYCFYHADNPKLLKTHIVLKHQIDKITENIVQCEYEDENTTNTIDKRQEFIPNEQLKSDWVFHCTLCQFECTKKKVYKAHLCNKHDLNISDIYKCVYCSESYEHYHNIQNHLANKHTTMLSKEPAEDPDFSNKSSAAPSAKKRRVDAYVEQNDHGCPEPDAEIQSFGSDDRCRDKKLPCQYPLCSRIFTKRSKLKQHMRVKHNIS